MRALLERILPLVAGTAPFLGAPPETRGAAARTSTSRLRRSLRASSLEGVVAEIVGACAGGMALTGWALHLGCSPAVIALLSALPFLAQVVQIPSAFVAARLGRKRVAVVAVSISRQVWAVLALLPLLGVDGKTARGVLYAVAAIAALAGVVANHAWTAWMADLVPRRIRGRYFGARTSAITIAGSLAALVAGLLLDGARARGGVAAGLVTLSLIASIAGWATTMLMLKQHEPIAADPSARLDLRAALRPFNDPRVRPFLAYQITASFAAGLSGGWLVLYMLRDLRLPFAIVAAHGVATAVVRAIAAPRSGRALDRDGRAVLAQSSLGLVASPLLWLVPFAPVPLLLDPIVSGVLGSGHALAAFALPLSMTGREERAHDLAALSTVSGASFATAAALSGLLLAAAVPAALMFALAAAARACAAILAVRFARGTLVSGREARAR